MKVVMFIIFINSNNKSINPANNPKYKTVLHLYYILNGRKKNILKEIWSVNFY